MQYGLVERTVYPFLLIFMIISLSSIVIHWHVARQILLEIMPAKYNTFMTGLIITLLSATAILFLEYGIDQLLVEFTKGWLVTRLAGEAFVVFMVLWAAWRRKKRHADPMGNLA